MPVSSSCFLVILLEAPCLAKRSPAAPDAANFRMSVACEDMARILGEKSSWSSKRGWHLVVRRKKMRSLASVLRGESYGRQGHNHSQHKGKLEEVHVFPNMKA
ncbi:hypothetical protein V6N13_011571 [Hibiscus sabdariffa]